MKHIYLSQEKLWADERKQRSEPSRIGIYLVVQFMLAIVAQLGHIFHFSFAETFKALRLSAYTVIKAHQLEITENYKNLCSLNCS
jgi:hypothetical protein